MTIAFPASSFNLGSNDWPQLHHDLAHWNHRRLQPAAPSDAWLADQGENFRMQRLEGQWIEAFRAEIQDQVREAPTTPAAFKAWFEALIETGPGQNDPLFPWLAEAASAEEMNWFLTQEAAGEAGFDDLVALAQLKVPVDVAKMELANNYWDEMGRGNLKGMHGPMLARAVAELNLAPSIDTTLWQSLALANTLTAFATTRRYAWHAIGALGVIELTAPGRVALVGQGLRRLGHPPVVRKYFDLHAVLDVRHARDWIDKVLVPLVEDDPSRIPWLAEGALMRLTCGQRCFDAYRDKLWSSSLLMAAE